MTTIQDYLTPKVYDTLDLTKVLLILNSSVPWDTDIATYYQSVRHLTDHRLSFTSTEFAVPFGASIGNTNTILQQIAAYITTHGIKAVICMPNVPLNGTSLWGFSDGTNYRYDVTLDAIFGAAVYLQHDLGYFGYNAISGYTWPAAKIDGGGNYSNPSGTASLPTASMTLKTPDGNGYNVIKTVTPSDFTPAKGSKDLVAWGRLGYPYWNDTNAVAQGVAKAQTYADTKRMIDDCIFAESQSLSSKVFCMGFGDYVQQGVHMWQWYAWQFAKTAGVTCKVYTNDAAGTGLRGLPANVRNNLTGWLGQPNPDYDSASVVAGTATVAGDVYLGGAFLNDWIAGAGDGVFGPSNPNKNYYFSLAPKRGAWAFNWCSAGQWFVENLIRRGGAAGIGPSSEPYTIGLPEDASVMSMALKGFSLCEILLYGSPPGWSMTAYGDPLYRPFKYTLPALDAGLLRDLTSFASVRTSVPTYNARNLTYPAVSRTLQVL